MQDITMQDANMQDIAKQDANMQDIAMQDPHMGNGSGPHTGNGSDPHTGNGSDPHTGNGSDPAKQDVAILAAIRTKSLREVIALYEASNTLPTVGHAIEATRLGRIDLMQYMYHTYTMFTSVAVEDALATGLNYNQELLFHYRSKLICDYPDRAPLFTDSVQCGILRSRRMDWLDDYLKTSGERICMLTAAKCNNLDAAILVATDQDYNYTSDSRFAKHGNIKALEWLYQKYRSKIWSKYDYYKYVARGAARGGRVDVLEWLYDQVMPETELQINAEFVEPAIKRRHFNVLQYANDIAVKTKNDTFLTDLAKYALQYPVLEIIKTLPIIDVSEIQHETLDVVEYLISVGIDYHPPLDERIRHTPVEVLELFHNTQFELKHKLEYCHNIQPAWFMKTYVTPVNEELERHREYSEYPYRNVIISPDAYTSMGMQSFDATTNAHALFIAAAACDRIDILEWCNRRFGRDGFVARAFIVADLKTARWIYANDFLNKYTSLQQRVIIHQAIMRCIKHCGRLDLLSWLEYIGNKICRKANLPRIKYPYSMLVASIKRKYDKSRVTVWLLRHKCERNDDVSLELAIYKGNIDTLRALYANGHRPTKRHFTLLESMLEFDQDLKTWYAEMTCSTVVDDSTKPK